MYMNFTKKKSNKKINLPEVPTLGLAIQGLCPGKDTALYHSPWKSVPDGSPDGKLKVAGSSLSMALRIYKYFKNHKSMF